MVYWIHPGIAEAIHTATPEAVTAAVDTTLATWWTAFAHWGIEQEQTGRDISQLVVQAGLAAVPYLLRRHDWHTAGYLLEQVKVREGHSPVIAQAVIPPLRRIAEATGEPKDLGGLATEGPSVFRTANPLGFPFRKRGHTCQRTAGHSLLNTRMKPRRWWSSYPGQSPRSRGSSDSTSKPYVTG